MPVVSCAMLSMETLLLAMPVGEDLLLFLKLKLVLLDDKLCTQFLATLSVLFLNSYKNEGHFKLLHGKVFAIWT